MYTYTYTYTYTQVVKHQCRNVYIHIHIHIYMYLKVVEHEGRNGACQHQRVLPVQPCICVRVRVCVYRCIAHTSAPSTDAGMYVGTRAFAHTQHNTVNVGVGQTRAHTHKHTHRACWCGPDETFLGWCWSAVQGLAMPVQFSLVYIHTYASSNSQYLKLVVCFNQPTCQFS